MKTQVKSRLKLLFERKSCDILSIYTTAGYPGLDDTATVVQALETAGVDLLELGMPYSDPLADGPTIQHSSQVALTNGMTLDTYFQQVNEIRKKSEIPILFMGYFNSFLQYGPGQFIQGCKDSGIDGLIIPDLPVEVYQREYQTKFEEAGLPLVFLVTPHTSIERIRHIDSISNSFI